MYKAEGVDFPAWLWISVLATFQKHYKHSIFCKLQSAIQEARAVVLKYYTTGVTGARGWAQNLSKVQDLVSFKMLR